MPPITPQLPSGRWRANRRSDRQIVVCGANQLAYRVVEELVTRYDENVTVVVRAKAEGWAPDIARLPNVRIVEAVKLDAAAFQTAKLPQARALALLANDDVGNLHAALRAREVKRGLRLVVRMANRNLRDRMQDLIPECTAASDASTAAPAFVAAALDRRTPLRLPNQSMVVVRRRNIRTPSRIICTLSADSGHPGLPHTLPDREGPDDLVLATADGHRRRDLDDQTVSPARRHRWPHVARRLIRLGPRRGLAVVVLVLVGLILAGVGLRTAVFRESVWYALYDSLMTVAGAANPTPMPALEQVIQVATTISGVLLIPAITAALVDWVVRVRLAASEQGPPVPKARHVIVAGLGEVGWRVVRQLNDMGEPVVAIETDEHTPGVDLARSRGVPVIIGDATQSATLSAAHVESCRALVPVTADDAVNLEVGLNARAAHRNLRVVLRIFDGELAVRVQEHLDITTSRSVAYLAAPKFAAALVNRQVIDQISVGRRVLLVAVIPIGEDTGLTGIPLGSAHESGQCRVIGLLPTPTADWQWTPPDDHTLTAGERIIVVATRAGLGSILVRSAVLMAPEG